MTVDVFYRNPHNFVRELAEVGEYKIAWDRGLLIKRRIDPTKHAQAYFAGKPWRFILVGEQGTAEYTHESPNKPVAVYPTWDAAQDDLSLLEEMCQYPAGEDIDHCNDSTIPDDERPVEGQEHRIVIINIPPQGRGPGRTLTRKLLELQEDYPEVTLHLHGLYTWRVCFGMGFKAVDIDPRTSASKGKIILPSGKEIFYEQAVKSQQWVNVIGMRVNELQEPRTRCIFNIKSARWAALHYMESVAFTTRPTASTPAPDVDSPRTTLPVTASQRPFSAPVIAQPTDKIACDSCSLQDQCKYYRQGSVCTLPSSEPASLARQFGTRDADSIIDGLGSLLEMQAKRLERGVADETAFGELDPEVTKLTNNLFANGAKLAKLLDPGRFAGPKVQVNVAQGGAASIAASNPNELMSSVVRAIEAQGIPRDQITPDMVTTFLQRLTANQAQSEPQMIQGSVVHD